MEIFHNDGSKIDRLNEILCEKAKFEKCYSISTQTYTRKVDLRVANALSAFGATVQKIGSDIRHLVRFLVLNSTPYTNLLFQASQKEMEEVRILKIPPFAP